MHRNAESRAEDWDTLAFQAEKAGEELRRAQIRYIGSGGTGDHRQDDKILQADHFTFSNMKLPPGAIGPEHNHHDAEEVFFVLEGQLEITIHDIQDGTRTASRAWVSRPGQNSARRASKPEKCRKRRCSFLCGFRITSTPTANLSFNIACRWRHPIEQTMPRLDVDLSGRLVVVTGAGRGLGNVSLLLAPSQGHP